MKKQVKRLWVYSTNNLYRVYGSPTKTHVVDEDSGRPLCGSSVLGTETFVEATWDWLHQPDPYGEICEKCRKAGILRLRPRAEYWYTDPFSGKRRSFPTLSKARKAASTEPGGATIFQLGPGDVNRIAECVAGRNPIQ